MTMTKKDAAADLAAGFIQCGTVVRFQGLGVDLADRHGVDHAIAIAIGALDDFDPEVRRGITKAAQLARPGKRISSAHMHNMRGRMSALAWTMEPATQ